MKKNNKKGFTIVELVIVIAVIAILSAVLIPTFAGVTNKSNKSAADQTAKSSLTVVISADDDGILDEGTYYIKVTQANKPYWYQVENNSVIYLKDGKTGLNGAKTNLDTGYEDLPSGVEIYVVANA